MLDVKLDLSSYDDNALYNLLTSGIISRAEYLAEMDARQKMAMAAELADYEWKTFQHRTMFGNK